MASHTLPTTAAQPGTHGLRDPAYLAFTLLRTTFTVAPIVFGLDKFFNLLTDWEGYLAPLVDRLVPGTGHQLMLLVGVVEIVAGVLVAVRPQIGAMWWPLGSPGSS
jgi:uncharacterized membrane protein YphA (DoxX/SURF4 family)